MAKTTKSSMAQYFLLGFIITFTFLILITYLLQYLYNTSVVPLAAYPDDSPEAIRGQRNRLKTVSFSTMLGSLLFFSIFLGIVSCSPKQAILLKN